MIAEEKRRIRGQVRARIAGVTAAARLELTSRAVALLLQQPEWNRVHAIMGYHALADELDMSAALRTAWEEGKTVALPRYLADAGVYGAAVFRGENLSARTFGIHEPGPEAPALPLNRLDFVLVPGVAFDRSGRRLGRGKGFYDRLLAEVTGVKCGVALEEQIVERLPSEPHDVAMDLILTPSRWIDVRSGGK